MTNHWESWHGSSHTFLPEVQGVSGKNFWMTKKNSESFMAYESIDLKFLRVSLENWVNTNKNTHILHRHITDWSDKPKNIYRFQCRSKHFSWGGGGRGVWKRAEGPRKLLNLESLKCHFLDLGGRFDRILMVRKQRFSTLKCTIWLQFSSFTICLQWAKAYLINYRIYWISCSRVYG
jgi:hypothetical protein